MAHITLVRHGQANSASHDEQSYDKLSDLGHQQARWLGDHMRGTAQHYDTVWCGTLRRHVETAAGMRAEGYAPVQQDARLNELAYFDLSHAYTTWSGENVPTSRDEFVLFMPRLMQAWQEGHLKDIPESFDSFEARIREVMEDIATATGRALVVTSGGVIGMVTRQVMQLSTEGYARACLSIMNTSVHRLERIADRFNLAQFNNVAHLEELSRQDAQTYI